MSVTIKDIAKLANVSITTVSRVINEKSEGIGEATRQRVLDIIKELDYRPNSIARSMVTKKTKTIGLIIPDIRNPFFPELVRGVEDLASQSEYSIFLCNTDGDITRETEYIRLMKEKNVDGIIYACTYGTLSKPFAEIIQMNTTPVVLIDRGLGDKKFSGVFIDNENAGYIATKHLLELSHSNIGCITGPSHIQNSQDRLRGYLKALTEAELPIDEQVIVSGEYQMEGGYQAAKTLLAGKQVTAIFAFNDLMAFGVYQAAAEMGIKIPDELSVVGFDNLKFNELLHPKLTTIDQPVYEIGAQAIRMLLKRIVAGKKARNKTVYLEPRLIVRGSSTRLKQ